MKPCRKVQDMAVSGLWVLCSGWTPSEPGVTPVSRDMRLIKLTNPSSTISYGSLQSGRRCQRSEWTPAEEENTIAKHVMKWSLVKTKSPDQVVGVSGLSVQADTVTNPLLSPGALGPYVGSDLAVLILQGIEYDPENHRWSFERLWFSLGNQ